MNQIQLLENMSPDLTREDAANQEVVDCLRILITKGVGFWMWQVALR
jgi:hypothetical protein